LGLGRAPLARAPPGHYLPRGDRFTLSIQHQSETASRPSVGATVASRATPALPTAETGLVHGAAPGAAGLPELLAPAGDWECARAAVENGADAIYFGLERFNARMRARNFTTADLPELLAFLHRRGVRGYVSLNTLIFTDELAAAEATLRACIAAGVDAVIVQDVGLCRMIRALSPDFPIHASTQMTISSAAGVAFARELGCQLAVLARECSLREIQSLRAEQAQALPLEVFVHGALCVAYSGQCLTSEALGGRSANRGECAQACRLPYQLVAEGRVVPLGDRRYLLSPRDLAGLELVPALVRVGVASLKIEGRLKSPEYVASITRLYRQALDGAAAQLGNPATPPESATRAAAQYEMEMAFSRGLHTGWFQGVNHQELVHGRFGKKRGVFLGEVTGVERDQVWVRLAGPLAAGDGVVFDAGTPDREEQGGRVYAVGSQAARSRTGNAQPRVSRADPSLAVGGGDGPEVALEFGRGDVDLQQVRVGDRLWKTSDPQLERRLRHTFTQPGPVYRRPIVAQVRGAVGLPLSLTLRDEAGREARVTSALPLALATRQPLTPALLTAQLGRLGGTPFRLARVDCQLEGAVMLPVSELNRLRREAVAQLDTLRATPNHWTLERGLDRAAAGSCPVEGGASDIAAGTAPAELIVLVRTLAQLEAALEQGVTTLYCEFEEPKRYREAVACFRDTRRAVAPSPSATHPQAGPQPAAEARPAELFLAPPRISKPGEEWILRLVRSAEADGYLVRNYDQLEYFRGHRCVGDYSFNVANPLSAAYFFDRYRLERLTASYDLNNQQLEALLRATRPERFEVTIHQHMPMFHMEHCLFCAFLSDGTDYTNCGRPCDRRELRLRDRVGAEHPVKADAGCRNTVFNALAQTGAEYVGRLMAAGARFFRIEFLDEPSELVGRTIAMYRQLLAGTISGATLWRELKLRHQLGVTRGALDKGDRPVTVL